MVMSHNHVTLHQLNKEYYTVHQHKIQVFLITLSTDKTLITKNTSVCANVQYSTSYQVRYSR